MGARTADREPTFKPKTRFHVFVIVRLLGMGGVAEVYEAMYMGKRCALKVLQRRFRLDRTRLPAWRRRRRSSRACGTRT